MPVPPVNQFRRFIHPKLQPRYHKERFGALNNATIQINHYYTKAWDAFCKRSKQPNATIFEHTPSRRDGHTFFRHEESCTQKDYTIQRFLIRLKIAQGKITDLPLPEEIPKGEPQNKS